jgi:hypothetical protein
VLTVLANQVAIAPENARLLSDARASAIQVQEVHNEFVRTEWSRTTKSVDQPGSAITRAASSCLNPMDGPDIESAVKTGSGSRARKWYRCTEIHRGGAPVKLRGEVIGVTG